MGKLELFRLLNDHLNQGWHKIKITKGQGRHTCFLCKTWLQKRKMKLLGEENGKTKHYVLCFGCWGDYKEWEPNDRVAAEAAEAAEAEPKTKKYSMVNHWRF